MALLLLLPSLPLPHPHPHPHHPHSKPFLSCNIQRSSHHNHSSPFPTIRPTSTMARQAQEAPPRSVVVVGAGVVGACTAYFLSKKGLSVTIVEQSSVASAASGKAGGFLASDWSDSSPLGPLSRASFRLHQELAEELDGMETYGYRPLQTLTLNVQEPDSDEVKHLPHAATASSLIPPWIDGDATVLSASTLGSTATTAQVHPLLFTRALVSAAMERWGARLLIGKLDKVSVGTGTSKVSSVVIDGGTSVSADIVVLAMGPWSSRDAILSSLTTRISGVKAHSVVLRPRHSTDAISPHALFLKYRTRDGKSLDPEVYPRPSGEVYICGMPEEENVVDVPDKPEDVVPRGESIEMLRRVAGHLSTHLMDDDAQVVAEQACFLPCSEDGLPLIGKVPGFEGLYVATGHSCWGILNGPATGASLAELIVHGHSQLVDLSPYDPARFVSSRSRRRGRT